MLDFLLTLYSWMPAPFSTICGAATLIFFIVGMVNLYVFILDLIPFVGRK